MLSYKAPKDIVPEDKENEMVAKKGDILREIKDEDYEPGDEFILCRNDRTNEEAYIEVAEYELFNEESERLEVQELEQEPPKPIAQEEVEESPIPQKSPVKEEPSPTAEEIYQQAQRKENMALQQTEVEKNEELLDLKMALENALTECENCKLETSALRQQVLNFKKGVTAVKSRFE